MVICSVQKLLLRMSGSASLSSSRPPPSVRHQVPIGCILPVSGILCRAGDVRPLSSTSAQGTYVPRSGSTDVPGPLPRTAPAAVGFAAASGNVRPLRLHVDGVERLAGGHEQPIALGAAEADIAANLRQEDQAD